MATGDLQNNLKKLCASLKRINYEKDVDYESLCVGVPSAFLPVYRFAFTDFSRGVASEIAKFGVELSGRNDQRFLEGMYKILRDVFNYKPAITKDQFFSNGFAEQKVIMATAVLTMVFKKHKALAPKPKVRVNLSMNTTASESKPKSKSATSQPPQKPDVRQKKKPQEKLPCKPVFPQVVSEVRRPADRTPSLQLESCSSGFLDTDTAATDLRLSPVASTPHTYNPAAYSAQSSKEAQSCVEIVSLHDELHHSDTALRPIDVVKTPGRPLVESHRLAAPSLQPITSSPAKEHMSLSIQEKFSNICQALERMEQRSESLEQSVQSLGPKTDPSQQEITSASKIIQLENRIESITQEKENLAARVTILENRIQLLEHQHSKSAAASITPFARGLDSREETPVQPAITEQQRTPLELNEIMMNVYEHHQKNEDKENRGSLLEDESLREGKHSETVSLADSEKASTVQLKPLQGLQLCSETDMVETEPVQQPVDDQAERIRNMMRDTQNLLGIDDSLSSEK